MSAVLSPPQLEALRAVCDAFVPALPETDDPHGFWARAASDLDVAGAIADLLEALPETDRREFRQLLDLLASPVLGVTWGGPMRPITALTPVQREAMLQRWSYHFVPALRKGFLSLKRLTGVLFYALAEPGQPNPNWPAIGYPGPPEPPAEASPPRLDVLRPTRDVTLTCGTVVVGSGAGGGVVAGELAEAGEDVLVVEKGPYVDRDGFDGLELRAMQRMYERQGALTTADGAVGVLAGSCLGGGTTINWAGSFRTPDYVLRQWADEHGLPHLLTPSFKEAFTVVEDALSVGTARGRHNPQNEALIRGARARGLAVEDIPRNTRPPRSEAEWRALGFSPFGDRYGTKQGMLDTYLRRAAACGARILASAEVSRVLLEGGRAVGVEALYRPPGGDPVRVTVRARRVVVAAGAIHTPALLMRSGVTHPHLGRHLFLHPTVSVAARYTEPVDPWHGPMMSAVCNAFTHLDGPYGPKLETPPIHAGILGMALPWASGRAHKANMAQARHVGAFIVLTRDRNGGHVTIDPSGQPVLHYRLSRFDCAHLLRGMQEAARIHLAAGAEEVHFPHNRALALRRDEDAKAFLRELPRWRWSPNRFALFSAHQMGTCRMGGDAARHPVRPDGQVWGVPGLYVADASVFPESSGANPMLSVQALAYHTARGLKAGSGVLRPALAA
jgi:choline dehydrogenase-like flavoprotein